MRHIIIVDYDPLWKQQFEQEAHALRPIFGTQLVALHHIGSTAIPNMPAKPIIDIMPVVKDISQVDSLNPQFITLGYDPMGELGLVGRRYFRKGGDEHRTHHVHVFAVGNPEVEKHILFRDYLIQHPDDATTYAAIKRQAAQDNPHNIEGYMDQKHDLIQHIMAKASAWHRHK